jgi:hypothetical protein
MNTFLHMRVPGCRVGSARACHVVGGHKQKVFCRIMSSVCVEIC